MNKLSSNTVQLDKLDQALLSALRSDGRASHARLAEQLKVTRATIKTRVERLEERGVILGYQATLASDTLGPAVRALMSIKITGHKTNAILARLRGVQWIAAIHSTNGSWDFIAEVNTDTIEELDRALSLIREIEGIADSETSILLKTFR